MLIHTIAHGGRRDTVGECTLKVDSGRKKSSLCCGQDFWLTVLYKRIVGGPVFSAIGRSDVRVYAACANTNRSVFTMFVSMLLVPTLTGQSSRCSCLCFLCQH